jgi:hypothetical protein
LRSFLDSIKIHTTIFLTMNHQSIASKKLRDTAAQIVPVSTQASHLKTISQKNGDRAVPLTTDTGMP